jgi:hypothetical protein
MNITLRPAETISIKEIVIDHVRDSFSEKKITAYIKNVPKPILLWDGEEEYIAAGNWTNESALARATEVLNLPVVPWTF